LIANQTGEPTLVSTQEKTGKGFITVTKRGLDPGIPELSASVELFLSGLQEGTSFRSGNLSVEITGSGFFPGKKPGLPDLPGSSQFPMDIGTSLVIPRIIWIGTGFFRRNRRIRKSPAGDSGKNPGEKKPKSPFSIWEKTKKATRRSLHTGVFPESTLFRLAGLKKNRTGSKKKRRFRFLSGGFGKLNLYKGIRNRIRGIRNRIRNTSPDLSDFFEKLLEYLPVK
jgi:hypothetical protein